MRLALIRWGKRRDLCGEPCGKIMGLSRAMYVCVCVYPHALLERSRRICACHLMRIGKLCVPPRLAYSLAISVRTHVSTSENRARMPALSQILPSLPLLGMRRACMCVYECTDIRLIRLRRTESEDHDGSIRFLVIGGGFSNPSRQLKHATGCMPQDPYKRRR